MFRNPLILALALIGPSPQPVDYQRCISVHNQDLFPSKRIENGTANVSRLV